MKILPLALALILAATPAMAQNAAPAAGTAPAAKAAAPKKPEPEILPIEQIPNYREEMRAIVGEIASYVHQRNPQAVVLARGGVGLLTKSSQEIAWEELRYPDDRAPRPASTRLPQGAEFRSYLRGLDGLVIDNMFCGLTSRDEPTAPEDQKMLLAAAARMQDQGRRVISFDRCGKGKPVAEAAAHKVLRLTVGPRADFVPQGHAPAENADHVGDLAAVRNLLPVLDTRKFGSREAWLNALRNTNHDMLVIDPFFHGAEAVTAKEVASLKFKHLGSKRLVLAAMNIGSAFDSAYYWQKGWSLGQPDFLAVQDENDPSAVIVRFWSPEWKDLLGKHVQGLMDLGFDGVMLENIDTFLVFEALTPVEG